MSRDSADRSDARPRRGLQDDATGAGSGLAAVLVAALLLVAAVTVRGQASDPAASSGEGSSQARQVETRAAGAAAGPVPVALGLAGGGVQFPDGSIQTTATTGMAPVPRTGRTVLIAPGDDGHLQAGVPWPVPRFTVNGDGTVTDELTGLVWLRDAHCLNENPEPPPPSHLLTGWQEALTRAAGLHDGCSDCGGTDGDCGLSDGSVPGEWRMPNIRELRSLVKPDFEFPALSDTAGTGQSAPGDPWEMDPLGHRWSSTTHEPAPFFAWILNLNVGRDQLADKEDDKAWIWPVRGGRSAGSPAMVARTGQSRVVAAGDDGDLQLGVRWPAPRFSDHGDGTVSDHLTGLVWLDDAGCLDAPDFDTALSVAAALSDGCPDCGGSNDDCGLTDGSDPGDWRLPNALELYSLVRHGFGVPPAVPDTTGLGQWSEGDPFSNVLLKCYYSSTGGIYHVDFGLGGLGDCTPDRVWPVKVP